mmetsp:Transcript_9499/g.20706  ORF Transcript_9499/g.20706 Transcript_9499/m.20706 type:complete len:516 (+) Transcript_9499:2694-4241(+)
MQHRVDEILDRRRQFANLVSLGLHRLEALEDGAEDVQVGGRTDVALVGREGEDCDGHLLLGNLLPAQARPLQRALGEHVDAVRLRDGAAGDAIAAGKNDGLHGAVELRQSDLERNLHRVKSELRILPLLEGLEGGRDGAEIRAVEILERGDRLRVVLRRRPAHERKSGEVDHDVHERLARIIEVVVDANREVERASVRGHDESTPRLELHDERDVVSVVLRVDVRLLQDNANDGGLVRINAQRRRVLIAQPGHVLLRGVKNARRDGVPDALVGDHLRRSDGHAGEHVGGRHVLHVIPGEIKKQRLDVLRRATEPVLQRHHEGARILRLVARQVLEHSRKRADQLQHGVLERSARRLVLLHEVHHHVLGLTHRGHRERANLVQAHHRRHRREDTACVKIVAHRLNCRNDLVSEVLHENQRTNENIRVPHILLKLVVVGLIAQLLQDVSHALDAYVRLHGVDPLACRRDRRLVLGFKHHIHNLKRSPPVRILRNNTAVLRVRLSEQTTGARGHHRRC